MSLLQIIDGNEYDDIFTERGFSSHRQVITNNNRLSMFYDGIFSNWIIIKQI